MRYVLFTAAGLAMLTGLAIAQEEAPPPPPAPMDQAGPAEDGPPPPPPGHGPKDDHGPKGDHGPRHGRDGDRPPPPPSKSADFRIEKGDLKVDVKCDDEASMKDCADLTLQLIDRVAPRP